VSEGRPFRETIQHDVTKIKQLEKEETNNKRKENEWSAKKAAIRGFLASSAAAVEMNRTEEGLLSVIVGQFLAIIRLIRLQAIVQRGRKQDSSKQNRIEERSNRTAYY